MGRFLLALAVLLWTLALQAPHAAAEFVGKLELTPKGCESAGECKLKSDFGYVDPDGIGWVAKAGLSTDGASIPSWAQSIVGTPFTEAYVAAAVIHDYYCVRHVRSWQDTHRVFFHALKESDVPDTTARIMYAAVFVGGPRWKDTIPGVGCPVGKMCVSSRKAIPRGTVVVETEEKTLKLVRNESYGPEFAADFEKLKTAIEAGDLNSLDQIEAAARQLRPDPIFEAGGVYLGE